MAKISVIVPVYNAEKYLVKCLDTLVNQTLKDVEIVVVNDGSKDNSQMIIEEYQNKYPDCIKAIKIDNGGVANARNIGMNVASGDYITFCDSDDYFDLDMLEELYNKVVSKKADIVLSGYYAEEENGTYEVRGLGNVEEYSKALFENPDMMKYTTAFACTKLFSRKLIVDNQLKFKPYRVFEDLLFFYSALAVANKVEKVDRAFYHYIRRENVSVTGTINKKFYDLFPVMNDLKAFYHEHNMDQLVEYLTFIFVKHAYIRFRMPVDKDKRAIKKQYIKDCYSAFSKFDANWKLNMYFKNKKKLLYFSVAYWMIMPELKKGR